MKEEYKKLGSYKKFTIYTVWSLLKSHPITNPDPNISEGQKEMAIIIDYWLIQYQINVKIENLITITTKQDPRIAYRKETYRVASNEQTLGNTGNKTITNN